jgi:hypothetical protein
MDSMDRTCILFFDNSELVSLRPSPMVTVQLALVIF